MEQIQSLFLPYFLYPKQRDREARDRLHHVQRLASVLGTQPIWLHPHGCEWRLNSSPHPSKGHPSRTLCHRRCHRRRPHMLHHQQQQALLRVSGLPKSVCMFFAVLIASQQADTYRLLLCKSSTPFYATKHWTKTEVTISRVSWLWARTILNPLICPWKVPFPLASLLL